MRLIRLASENAKGIISNDFQQEIIISPQSKIALKSMSIEVQLSQIQINSSNDTINFQVQSSQGTLIAKLSHNNYDNITAPSLFADMNMSMNSKIRSTGTNVGKNLGLEIRNAINSRSTFQCAMKQGSLKENTSDLVLDKGDINIVNTGGLGLGVFSAATPPSAVTPFNSFFYDPNPIARGGGVVRFKINKIANVTDNFILGLTYTNPDTITGGTFPEALLDYGIVCLASANNYATYYNGVSSVPLGNILPNFVADGSTENDSITLSIDQGNVVGTVFQNDSGKLILIIFQMKI